METKKSSQLIFSLKSRNSVHQFGIDFDCLKAIFNYIINELSIETNDYQILLVTPHKYSDKINIEFIKLLIEQLKFSAITIINQSLLVLYSYNVTSGIIVNLSEKIEITPICDGIVFQNGVSNLAYGASTMSEYLNSFVSRSHFK
jgi:actin-related protein